MKILSRALVAGSGIAAVGMLAATTALAHPGPFTVTAGSAPANTAVAVTGTSSGATPQITFRDTTTGINLVCASAVLKGSVTTGSSTGVPLATVNGSTAVFNSCTGPAGLQFAVTGFGTWNINVSDSTSGVSTGTVSNIRAHVVATAGPTCSFDVGANSGTFTSSGTSTISPGTVAASYTNSTRALAVPVSNPGSLGLWNVKGSGTNTYCISPSIIKQTDKASFSGTFILNADVAANNPVAVN
jgi:hypothetical protein